MASDPGSNLSSAYNFGNFSGSIDWTWNDFVSTTSDTADYYHFSLSNASNFNINLGGLSADADLELFDSNGSLIQGSYRGGTADDSINRQLAAGDYYVRVDPFIGDTNYTLSIDGNGMGVDPGNTLGTAFDYGQFGNNVSRYWNESVSSSDTNDYYNFYLSEASTVNLSLTGMSADADLRLLDSSGNFIQGSFNTGSTNDSLSQFLQAGNYNILVSSFNGADTNYTMNLSV